MARQVARGFEVDDLLLEELVDHRAPHVELDEAGPAGVGGELVAVLVGLEADDAGLEAQRQVLGDDDDVAALAPEADGHREDAVVVGVGDVSGCGSASSSWWLSSTRSVPPSSLTGIGSSSDPWRVRRSSRKRRLWRAAQPSSGWWRFPSSSVSTTSGSTTSCSAKRVTASGSARRTDVSMT